MEIWKDVVGAEPYYQVSNIGNVRNKITNQIVKPSSSGPYLRVELRYGVNKHKSVHRLVAEAFIPNPMNFRYVNHKDENKKNNCVENLEWCTAKYNVNYGVGSLARNQRIIQYDMKGNAIKIWERMKDASEELNITAQLISACCRGKKKTAGGYVWTYANYNNVRQRWKKTELPFN